MKISKINAEAPVPNTTNAPETAETTNPAFKAIKLRKSALKMPEQLTKDCVELRKNLPDNKMAKNQHYFGNPNIGTGGNQHFEDPDSKDVIKFLIGWGAAIAAAALM